MGKPSPKKRQTDMTENINFTNQFTGGNKYIAFLTAIYYKFTDQSELRAIPAGYINISMC